LLSACFAVFLYVPIGVSVHGSEGDTAVKHVNLTAFDLPDAWFQTLSHIWTEGDTFTVGRGSETTETKKLNLTIEILHPENRPLVSDKAPCDIKYVQGYALEYLWSGEKQEDEPYTYASRLRTPVDQIGEAVNRYVEQQNDRQVTMVIRLPTDINEREPPCLSLIDTEIIEGKMHLTCYFRSWDAYGGLPANIAGLQMFNEAFVAEINSRANLDLETGKLIFHSKNAHIYERQYKLVQELLNPKNTKNLSAKFNVKKPQE
jgi:thymidylate synthase